MSSGAAQLSRHRGGRCRHAEPSWVASAADATTRARFGSPSRHRRRRGRPGCPDAGHAVRRSVRVRCPPCGRTPVQLVGRTPGVQATGVQATGVHATGVQASGVHATGVHTTGVIQVSGQPGVRCPRPLPPRCPYHAGSQTSVRRDRPRLGNRVRRVAAAGERRGGRCPNRAWWRRDGGRLVVRGWHERRRQPGRRLAGVQAAAPRSPPGRPWELVQRQVPVGWRGSREGQVLPRRPACACWAGRRRDGRPWGWTGRW